MQEGPLPTPSRRCPPFHLWPLSRSSSHPLLPGASWSWAAAPPPPMKPKCGFKRALAHGTELDLQQTKAAWPRGAEIPGCWHHKPARHPAARMRCRRGAETEAAPKHAAAPRPVQPEIEPLLGRQLGAGAGQVGHPRGCCPDSRAPRKTRACPVPFQPWPAHGAKSCEGHAVAPAHSSQASLPPPLLLPTRAENTPSGSDLEPCWLRPKCR